MRKLALLRPSRAEGECHEDMWRQISISARGRAIDVRKAKSHTDVAGNETADSLAKRGRQCPLTSAVALAWTGVNESVLSSVFSCAPDAH